MTNHEHPTAESIVVVYSIGAPVLMKTPRGGAVIGFASANLAKNYLSRFELPSERFTFEKLSDILTWMRPDNKRDQRIILFRSEEDLRLHFEDRANFPYSEFEIALAQFEPTPVLPNEPNANHSEHKGWWKIWK